MYRHTKQLYKTSSLLKPNSKLLCSYEKLLNCIKLSHQRVALNHFSTKRSIRPMRSDAIYSSSTSRILSMFPQNHSFHTSYSSNKEVNHGEFEKLQSKGAIVIDVRESNEIKSSGTVTGSINIPRKFFSTNMPSVNEEFRHLDYTQLNDVNSKGNSIVIDVREKYELDETGTIPGSHHIPLGDVENALVMPPEAFENMYKFKKPNPEDNVIFSCRSGKRSMVALEKALAQGFTNAKHYSGGWLDWEKNTSNQK